MSYVDVELARDQRKKRRDHLVVAVTEKKDQKENCHHGAGAGRGACLVASFDLLSLRCRHSFLRAAREIVQQRFRALNDAANQLVRC